MNFVSTNFGLKSCDFKSNARKITRMISNQIALHSDQLPLLIIQKAMTITNHQKALDNNCQLKVTQMSLNQFRHL